MRVSSHNVDVELPQWCSVAKQSTTECENKGVVGSLFIYLLISFRVISGPSVGCPLAREVSPLIQVLGRRNVVLKPRPSRVLAYKVYGVSVLQGVNLLWGTTLVPLLSIPTAGSDPASGSVYEPSWSRGNTVLHCGWAGRGASCLLRIRVSLEVLEESDVLRYSILQVKPHRSKEVK